MHTLHSMQHQWVHLHEQAQVHTHTHMIMMKQLIIPASWASYLSISERLCQGEGAEVEGHEDRVKLCGHLMQRLGRLLQLRHQCCELVKHGRLKMEHSNTLEKDYANTSSLMLTHPVLRSK